MNNNHFSYTGQISFMPQLRTTSNGGQFLPITLRQESSSVSIALFDVLATTVANSAATGQTISIEGWMTSRKNQKTGYFETSLNGQRLSLDNGRTWYTAEPKQQAQQNQQVQGQPVQQQTLHQQVQGFRQPPQSQPQPQQQQQSQVLPQSGQTQQPQMTQSQPVTQQQQFQQQAPQQTREQFLDSNPYRQQPPSPQAQQAQQQPSQGFGEFDSMEIPF